VFPAWTTILLQKMTAFWDIAPYTPEEGERRFITQITEAVTRLKHLSISM
jgi:hypothetical protein